MWSSSESLSVLRSTDTADIFSEHFAFSQPRFTSMAIRCDYSHMGKRHGGGNAHQRAVAAERRTTVRGVVPNGAANPVVPPPSSQLSNPPKSPQSRRDWLRAAEEFLRHPLLWGVVALIALAIALGGKLSVSMS